MTYKESLDFLYAQLPIFQRIGAAAYKPGLDNTLAIAQAFGNPHVGLKCIHVAGTNGKGSTSHMLASVFQEMGWKTGLYTSPHLKDFRERIKIDGKKISKKFVVDFVRESKGVMHKIKPSFFELTCIMALKYFQHCRTDIVIVETGLGGRLDSTNIVFPDLSVITNISKDHQQFLGNTLKKIATEKAGIIKHGIPVVIGAAKGDVKKVFQKVAKENESPLFFAENIRIPKNFTCELKGTYQSKNIRTVIQSINTLNRCGYSIPQKQLKQGIAKVVTNTGLMGRWQMLSRQPYTIADIGHNADGITQVVKNLAKTPYKHLHMIIGVVNDKDIKEMLQLLPKKATYYFTNAAIPRALPATQLQAQAKRFNLKGECYSTVKQALKAAQNNSAKGDLVFVGGSAFVVAEVL